MILIALGSNLPAPPASSPLETLEAAMAALADAGIEILAASRWYVSEPQPPSGQPDFINGVVRAETGLGPAPLLDLLHDTEARFGRVRGSPNDARTLDLDLIDYRGQIRGGRPTLPHPRAHLRNFVLLPLADVAPGWRHPVSRRPVADLIDLLPAQGPTSPMV
jgi:2-amino-4-hydroxy-6-hydroxymethyldihydropteridine diphosphokinase